MDVRGAGAGGPADLEIEEAAAAPRLLICLIGVAFKFPDTGFPFPVGVDRGVDPPELAVPAVGRKPAVPAVLIFLRFPVILFGSQEGTKGPGIPPGPT